MTTVYQQLRDAGCTLDSHESDLYVQSSETAKKILAANKPLNLSMFHSPTDGKWWYELPFAFDPWWESKRPAPNKR